MNTKLRAGQAAFNALYEVAPEMANAIRGSEADPFYVDKILPEFFRAVIREAQITQTTGEQK